MIERKKPTGKPRNSFIDQIEKYVGNHGELKQMASLEWKKRAVNKLTD